MGAGIGERFLAKIQPGEKIVCADVPSLDDVDEMRRVRNTEGVLAGGGAVQAERIWPIRMISSKHLRIVGVPRRT